jgi:hypothetical protein
MANFGGTAKPVVAFWPPLPRQDAAIRATDAGDYWTPAFAGMTTSAEEPDDSLSAGNAGCR